MMQPQLVIFDFDGTLADSLPWVRSVFDDVARRWGFRPLSAGDDQALRQMRTDALLRYLGVPGWKIPLIAADMRRRMSRDIHVIQLFPGVASMLEQLAAAGPRLGIVSSNATGNIKQVLGARLWGLLHYTECGAGIAGKHRRLTRLLRRARVQPQHAIYIGDEIRDIDAARRAGTAAGAVAWGCNPAQTLAHQRPDLLFFASA